MSDLPLSSSSTPYDVIKRRPVGKTAWKVTVHELIESERALIAILRLLGNRHPNDTETQRLLGQAALESAERLGKLHELAIYREIASGSESEAAT